MKKIIFDVSDDMFTKIDEAAVREGFMSRPEFLRFLIVTYFKKSLNDFQKETETTAELDLEYGIPANVVKKIEEVARKMIEAENGRQQLS